MLLVVFAPLVLLASVAVAMPTDNPMSTTTTTTTTVAPVRYCVTSDAEETKCAAMKTSFAGRELKPDLECVRGVDRYDCMQLIEERKADLISLWSADTYVAGKFHHLVPILVEKHTTEPGWPFAYFSLAVVHKSSTIRSLEDLRGRRSCHTGINRHVGWLYPNAQFVQRGLYATNNNDTSTASDCVSSLPAVASFFNGSCASGANLRAFNPDGKYESLCSLCAGEGDKKCSKEDPYASYTGAFKCLIDNKGEVAFVKDTTFAEVLKERPDAAKEDYELLCLDGTRKTLDDYKTCNWGSIPERAVVTSPQLGADAVAAVRQLFFAAQRDQTVFKLFESAQPGDKNVMFGDRTKELISTDDKDDYRKFLGDYVAVKEHQLTCEAEPAKWCTISEAEQRKCLRMRDAFNARFIKPDVECVQAEDAAACLKMLKDKTADVVTLDGGDVYEGGKQQQVQVLMSEDSSSSGGSGAGDDSSSSDAKYWAVAVVKKDNQDITFNSLRGKKSCHTGIGKTAGWKVPLGTLISVGQLPPAARCNLPRAAGAFFGASCAPGALSPAYNSDGTNPDSLCSLCAGTGSDKCARSEAEPFYGYTGAFRCLATGAGDVAFVKHSTPAQNTDGHNTADDWPKDLKADDFELLCKDGTRKPVADYATCSLAKVAAHAVVTSADKSADRAAALVSLLEVGQHYYADKSNASAANFQLFSSPGVGGGAKDLIFTDTTTRLRALPLQQRDYRRYLGDMAVAFDHLGPSSDCDAAPASTETTTAAAAAVTVTATPAA